MTTDIPNSRRAKYNLTILLSREEKAAIDAARGITPISTWCRAELLKKAEWLNEKRAERGIERPVPTFHAKPAVTEGSRYVTNEPGEEPQG